MSCSMDTSEIIQCDQREGNMQCNGIGGMHTASPAGEKLIVQLVLKADFWRKF